MKQVSSTNIVYATSTASVYVPLLPPMERASFSELRVSVEVNEALGDIQVQAFYEVSDDLVTWTDRTNLGGVVDKDDTKDFSAWTSGINTGKRYLRTGVRAYNSATGDANFTLATLVVETR